MKKPTTVTDSGFSVLFGELQNTIHKYLRLDKDRDFFIDLVLASAISIQLDKPIWAMIEAPSSSGKTEILTLLQNEPNYEKVHTLTRKTLFSGHADAKGGFIPAKIGDQGILCFPDFTTVLSLRSDDRAEVFNQLRVAYDGEAGSATGVEIEKMVTWKGKLACLACVTGAIEKYKDKASDLGERFMYLNHEVPKFSIDFKANPKKKLLSNHAAELAHSIIKLAKEGLRTDDLIESDRVFINRLASMIAQSRAVVERGAGRNIEEVNAPEEPYRLIEQLESLFRCLVSIHGDNSSRVHEVLRAVTVSSVPQKRWKVLKALRTKGALSIDEIAHLAGMVETTVRRTIDELQLLNLVVGYETHMKNRSVYSLTDEVRKELNELSLG